MTEAELEELDQRATARNNAGVHQCESGQYDAALASLLDAVELARELIRLAPGRETFALGLVYSLRNLSRAQLELQRSEDALASAQEAVALCRALAGTPSETALYNLGSCLNSLGVLERRMAHHEDAFTSTQEAADLLWVLFVAKPQEVAAEAEIVLRNLDTCHRETGRAPPEELFDRYSAIQAALAAF